MPFNARFAELLARAEPAALDSAHHVPGGDSAVEALAAMAPHGVCLLWQPGLVWLHVISDSLIALAYFSIPFALVSFARRRTDFQFRWVLHLFAGFIVACAATHLMGIWTLWNPDYLAQGLVKSATAAISVTTAVLLWPLVPKALAIPSAAALEHSNARLQAEIEQRERAQTDLGNAHADLEHRVAERTEALREANRRLEAEVQERRRAEDRFRLAVESSPSAMLLVDRAGAIVLANAQAERIFGYAREDLVGASVERLVPGRFGSEHPALRAAYLASPRARAMGAGRDLYAARADGSEFPVEIGLNPVESEDGTYVLAAVVDITERKRADAQRREYVDALERANSDLARSNEELEQFAYVASHDLREPLRMVEGFTQLLKRDYGGRLDADADEYIDYAVDGAQRMRLLIDHLLEYSHVGTRQPNREPVSLDEVLATASRDLEGAVAEVGGRIEVDGPLPNVTGDRIQLVQVFENLLGNALKFRGDAAPVVRVRAEAVGERWRISFEDNGIGIEPRFHGRVFEIFRRLHARDAYPGTGIGLAMCKRIVEKHGGRIGLDSEPGAGSTFWVELPAAPDTGPDLG